MAAKFIQVNCKEGKSADLRQAHAVLRYKPDVIFLEYARDTAIPQGTLSGAATVKKIEKYQAALKKTARKFPWVISDVSVWENIKTLIRTGHKIAVYPCDAPREIVDYYYKGQGNAHSPVGKDWLWWARIYIRERYMAKTISAALKKTKKKDPVVLVFLQSFHWKHVQFLMANPNAAQIWKYYFAKFKEVSAHTIGARIQQENKVFSRHWTRLNGLSIKK